MKKLMLFFLSLFLITGCSWTKDELQDAKIYTTVYPIEYLADYLYGDYAEIKSIYPQGANINEYTLTDKQLKDYSKSDIFIYNGLSNEKTTTKNLINKNKNLLIIDAAYGLSYTYGVEELWLSPNNYLMLSKNIRDYLVEYLKSKNIIDSVNAKYQELSETLSIMDADLREVGRNAKETGNNIIIVTDDVLKYLENYGFNVVSLDSKTVTDATLTNINNAFKKGTYKNIIILNNNASEAVTKMIKEHKVNQINFSSLINGDINNDDYLANIKKFIDTLRNLY